MQTTHGPHGGTARPACAGARWAMPHSTLAMRHGPGKAKEREEGFYAAGAKKGSLPLTSHAESGYARMPGSS